MKQNTPKLRASPIRRRKEHGNTSFDLQFIVYTLIVIQKIPVFVEILSYFDGLSQLLCVQCRYMLKYVGYSKTSDRRNEKQEKGCIFMKFTILGSCSGTEPMPGRRHTSTLLTSNDHMYLLDAGDSCAYTAHLLGYDLTKLESIFISHPHIDHVGGLPYLFFLLRKLCWRRGESYDRVLRIYTPSAKPVVAALTMNDNHLDANTLIYPVKDGKLFDDGNLIVHARHNTHMNEICEPYHSFSYLLSLEGKTIVYSGDVKNITELQGWLDCDLLMMETGHHDPMQVASYLSTQIERPQRLLFVHNGRTMLATPEGCLHKCREILDSNIDIAFDGMTFDF